MRHSLLNATYRIVRPELDKAYPELPPNLAPAAAVEARWETETRYYAVVLELDLLGDWVLTVARGGRRNRLGKVQHKMMANREAGEREIERLDRRRRARGYLQVEG